MLELRAVKFYESDGLAKWAVVKTHEDDPRTWGLVAWASHRDEALRIIHEAYERRSAQK